MSRRRVVITGLGMLTPVGATREVSWKRIQNGASGVRRLIVESPTGPIQTLGAPAASLSRAPVNSLTVPQTINYRSTYRDAFEHQSEQAVEPDYSTRLANLICEEAVRDAGLEAECRPDQENLRFGCAVATSKGSLSSLSQAWTQLQTDKTVSESDWCHFLPGQLSATMASTFGCHGPCSSPVAACATGLHAVIAGANWITDGNCDVVLAGCVDASLNPLVLGCYRRMGVLASDDRPYGSQAVRPFCTDRQGFVIGEGGAAFLLEDAEHAVARGAMIYGEVAGWASLGDAHSMTGLSDNAESLVRGIELSLERAQMTKPEVDMVNCHGTGTISNDKWESQALREVFGKGFSKIHYTANKSIIGHLLGASGGVELGLTLLALRDGIVPPTLNTEHLDPQCGLSLSNTRHHAKLGSALKLSFGFGGHVAVVAIRQPSDFSATDAR